MPTDVVIVGGGPCGLMLANELGRRGVAVSLFDAKPTTAFNPQANATQARTMEHFRRLGFADEIRALGLPEDFPTDIAYFTRYAGHELGRFALPSAREARARVASLSGSWSAAELPHRVSQKYVEAVLRRHAEALPSVAVRFGWRLAGFSQDGETVRARFEETGTGENRELDARYLVGADGARSLVRKTLGIAYGGESGAVRDFFGGRMYAIYLRAPAFYETVPHPPAWMNVTFNRDRRAFMAATDGRGEFAFHTQLRPEEDEDAITDADALAMFQAAVGAPIEAEILSRMGWTAGYALVAERFGEGRVLLGGDAAHLFTPAGGLGYNTAVDDAVNLGWKLAAVLKGEAGPALVASYETERRPLALRNTGFARDFAASLGTFAPAAEIEDETEAGDRARAAAGAYLAAHGRREFDVPGVTFGGRYDGSPVIVPDGAPPPASDRPDVYEPSGVPGGRAPHAWLADGVSLFDRFGFGWTLLRFAPAAPSGLFEREARRRAVSLKVLDLADDRLAALYGAPLALVRPDQIVAWRGGDDRDAVTVWDRVLGWDTSPPAATP